MSYRVHTINTAPAAARQTLEASTRAFGFLPNLLGVMAEAPALLKAYPALIALFDETSLTPVERQVVLLSASVENGCDYCMAAHTAIAAMQGVPVDVVQALRQGRRIDNGRLEALRRFTSALVTTRGRVSASDMDAFLDAGYSRAQVLEVVLGVGAKTLSNYTNHLAETPVDAAFQNALAAPSTKP